MVVPLVLVLGISYSNAQGQLATSNITANDFTTAADTEGAPDTESISFKIQLKPHSNKFLADKGWYELAKSINGITNDQITHSSTNAESEKLLRLEIKG